MRLVLLCLLLVACITERELEQARDRDGDGYAAWQVGGDDCDDADADINPGEQELCGNGIDDDCDGAIDDDGLDGTTFHADADGDGYGDPARSTSACTRPEGHVADATDCDDADATIHPGATELCDGLHNDCATTALPGDEIDDDGDGHVECDVAAGPGWRGAGDPDGLDCDDADATVHPGATELCDGLINDCTASSLPGHEVDDDGDGYVECTVATSGWSGDPDVVGGDDCDDDAALVYPGAPAVCDGLINDCAEATLAAAEHDDDGDGYVECTIVTSGWSGDANVIGGDDCNDTPDVGVDFHPGADEIWYDGEDQACDGGNDFDQDGDGFASDEYGGADCEDALANVNPGADEVCNDFLDNDCDGTDNGCRITGEYDLGERADAVITKSATCDRNSWMRDDPTPGIAVGDENGDGVDDLWVVTSCDRIVLLRGPFSNQTATSTAAVYDLDFPSAIANLASGIDLDGNGMDDLLVGEVGVHAFLSPGQGSTTVDDARDLASAQITAELPSITYQDRLLHATENWNGNGIPGVVTSNRDGNDIHLFLWEFSEGGFTRRAFAFLGGLVPDPPPYVWGATCKDASGDGFPDLVASADGTTWIWTNPTGEIQTDQAHATIERPGRPLCGNVLAGPSHELLLQEAGLAWVCEDGLSPGQDAHDSSVDGMNQGMVLDVDLDGDNDLAMIEETHFTLHHGPFDHLIAGGDWSHDSLVAEPAADAPQPFDLASGDVNGDGYPDMIVDTFTDRIYIFYGRGL